MNACTNHSHTSKSLSCAWGVALMAACMAVPASAQPRAIFSSDPLLSNAQIPFVPALPLETLSQPRYNTAGTEIYPWSSIALSPNGRYIAMLGYTSGVSTPPPEVIVVRDLQLGETRHVARTGEEAPFAAGISYLEFDDVLGVNDDGVVAFSGDLAGVPTSVRDFVATYSFASDAVSLVARRGDSAAAVAGLPFNAIWGIFDSATIDNAGNVGFRSNFITGTGITTANDQIMVVGSTIVGRDSVTIPAGQLDGNTTRKISSLFSNGLRLDGAGGWLLQATLEVDSATNTVLIVNGTVVVQKGFTLPSLTSPISLIFPRQSLGGGGEWIAAGENTDLQDWVYDGAVLARTGDPILPMAGETWFQANGEDDTFFTWAKRGSHVAIGGDTTGPAGSNQVVVRNLAEVILRTGDAVDLDGNGVADDRVYLDRFRAGDLVLDADGHAYVLIGLRDILGRDRREGTAIGQALITTRPFTPQPADLSVVLDGQSVREGEPLVLEIIVELDGPTPSLAGTVVELAIPAGLDVLLDRSTVSQGQLSTVPGGIRFEPGTMGPGIPAIASLRMVGPIGRYSFSAEIVHSLADDSDPSNNQATLPDRLISFREDLNLDGTVNAADTLLLMDRLGQFD